MWLERFGTVDQNIFFGFCAVVFVIVVLVITYFVVRICYFCCRHIPIPGYSLTSTLVLSTLFICVSVLFRGVQPSWKTGDTPFYTLSNVCQIHVPMIVLGYVMFGAALFIKLWMIVIAYRLAKNVTEFIANFVLWVLVILAGTAIIIWIASFTPNVFEKTPCNITTNETVQYRAVYECRGWLENGSRDLEQYAWRVATSVYMAVILLLAIVALPFHACENEVPIPKFALPDVVATIVICVNTTCCVIAGLIVWFQYHPQSSAINNCMWEWYQLEDSRKYAIIGSLQLWMIFVAVVATLISEVLTVRMARMMYSSDTTDIRKTPQTKQKTPYYKRDVVGIGAKKQNSATEGDENDGGAAVGDKKKRRKKKETRKGKDDNRVVENDVTYSSSTRNSARSSKDSVRKDDRTSTYIPRNNSTDEGYRSETTTTTSAPDLRTKGDGSDEETQQRDTADIAVTEHASNTEQLELEYSPPHAAGVRYSQLDDSNRISYRVETSEPTASTEETSGHVDSAFTAGYSDESTTATAF